MSKIYMEYIMLDLISNKNNPFRQSKYIWLVEFDVKYAYLSNFESCFEDECLSCSFYEKDASFTFESKPDDIWCLSFYFGEKPDINYLRDVLASISESLDIKQPEINLSQVEDVDWVSEVQKNFPPFCAGKFFIHGSHIKDSMHGKINIEVDASRAFGTGEHETTFMCLEALCDLSKSSKFGNVLDMGTGSGILAIAASKLWNAKIIASDIDMEAIKIATNNCKLNKTIDNTKFFVADGYKSIDITENGLYDLIISNILAKPLVKMAKYLSKVLKNNGVAVLSGFLNYQENMVLNAHRMHGLSVMKKYQKNNWCCLVLKK